MQLGPTRLSPAERQPRINEGRCIYCAQLGHFISSCPVKAAPPGPSTKSLVSVTNYKNRTKRQLTVVTLSSDSFSLSYPALVDSGADGNLMSYNLAKQLNLTCESIPQPLSATALNGRLMCPVVHQTSPLSVILEDGHTEQMTFYLYHSTHHPLILGYPWLKQHNPQIDGLGGRL